MRFSEEQLINWTKPSTETETSKCENSLRMIRNALNSVEKLKNMDIELIPQGSYENNTNVRTESDVDICVMLKDTVFTKCRDGVSMSDYGYTDSTYKFEDYKTDIYNSMALKFGKENIKIGNKSIKINSNTYRVDADVVPAFQFRDFSNDYSYNPSNYIEGIKYYSKDMEEVINYPKLHTKNGINKNNITNMAFKKVVRLIKHIRYNMIDLKFKSAENVSSFILECLLYNVPNSYFYNIYFSKTYMEILESIVEHMIDVTSQNYCINWKEVNEINYIFSNSKKRVIDYYVFFNDVRMYLEI